MSAWRSIVLGVDFTPCSAAALRQAIRIAEGSRARLEVVHVLETLVVTDLEEALAPHQQGDLRAGLVNDARKAWRDFTAGVEGASALELQIEIDTPTGAVLRRVKASRADLLVLGTHGTSRLDRGAGTLATACVRHAEASVLLVREQHGQPFRSVVACVDFSPTSRRALEAAVRMALLDRATLHVLHVFDAPWHRLHYRAPTPQAAPDYQKQYRDALQRSLESFSAPLLGETGRLDVRHELFDYQGHGAGITEFVTSVGGDLVVLGTRGRTNLRDLLLGSTAERVLRDAPCSILAVRPEGFGSSAED
jgi:nucleotide-binding universal stress UspA family protein